MILPSRIVSAYPLDVGTYTGSAVLLDEQQREISVAQVSLATTDLVEGGWRGYAYGIDLTAQDGHEIVVELPHGTSGRARVVIDLTADEPIVRLVGLGAGPI